MTLHLWDQARDPHHWISSPEVRPVLCGRRVNYQQITRDPENVTCPDCERALVKVSPK